MGFRLFVGAQSMMLWLGGKVARLKELRFQHDPGGN